MQERWKEVPGYENLYKVSNLGRVFSIKKNKFKKVSPKRLTGNEKNKILPYLRLNLCKNGVHKHWFLHRLVMFTFQGPMPDHCEVVLHLNDDPKDCRLENLRYGTQKENVIDCYSKGRGNINIERLKELSIIGANVRKKRIIAIKDGQEQSFDGVRPAGIILGIPSSSIANVLARRRKSANGYTFKYAA